MLTVAEVGRVKAAGGVLIVSPNRDDAVIRATKAAGLDSYPGVFTATEALGALAAGADALKFFPADVLGTAGIKAIRAILPEGRAAACGRRRRRRATSPRGCKPASPASASARASTSRG